MFGGGPRRILAYLASNGLHDAGQVVVLPLARLHPRCEVTQLAIVAIIRKPHLWANEEDLAIVDDHAAVVYHILVHHRPVRYARYETNTQTHVGGGTSGGIARKASYHKQRGREMHVHPDIAENVERVVR